MKNNEIEGFTLIELLLVMAVIAILIGVLLPAFRGMQNEAYRTKTDKELISVQTALEGYYKNYGSYPANSTTWFSCLTGATRILLSTPIDYFKTAQVSGTIFSFSYSSSLDAYNMPYYVIGSKGTTPGTGITYSFNSMTTNLTYSNKSDYRIFSNMPVNRL